MTDPLNGLRFDIYERVHLPEDVAAIEELEEIELVPHMQAQPQGDHVLLRGHLLLSGVYRPQERDGGAERLEHWIPVEITLPQNRVLRVEDLAVEIDNFDVDLLSARSLNVTGVLSLRGLQAEPRDVPVWRDDSFTVVHQAGGFEEPREQVTGEEESPSVRQAGEPPEDEEPLSASVSAAEPDSFEEENIPPASHPYFASAEGREEEVRLYTYPPNAETGDEPAVLNPYDAQPSVHVFESVYDEPPRESFRQPDSEPVIPAAPAAWPSDEGWGDLSERRPDPSGVIPPPQPVHPPFAAMTDSVQAEKAEMRVAFGGKTVEEPPARLPTGVGLLSQLGEKGAIREAEQQAIRMAREAEAAETRTQRSSTGDELEWTRLFLGKGEETQQFRRVRMCIVQREETLESIAARYNVQVREIQLRNRLSDPYLSEGQVLYIP